MISVRVIVGDGLKLLTPQERRRAYLLVPLFVLAGFVEMLALGSVAPLASLLVAPDSLKQMPLAANAFAYLGLTETRDIMIALASSVMGFLVFAAGFTVIVQHWFRSFCTRCGARMGTDVYRLVLGTPYTFLLRRNAARLASEIQNDLAITTNVFIPALFASFYALSLVVFGIIMIVGFSAWQGFVGVVAIGVCAFLAHKSTRATIQRLAEEGRLAVQDGAGLATQAFVGLKDIKIKHAEDAFSGAIGHAFTRLVTTRQQQIFLQQLVPLIFTIIGQLGLIAVAVWMLAGGVTFGQVVSQITLLLLVFARLIPAANRLIAGAQRIHQSEPHIRALKKLIAEAAAENAASSTTSKFPDAWQHLALRDVCFAYAPEEGTTLDHVSIDIRRGRSYGIAGPSGAGKSTLVDILLGLLVPSTGMIEIDGTPADLSDESWHRRVGYVPQSTFILDDNVRRNVAFTSSDEAVDDERVYNCLAMAGLRSLRGEAKIDLGLQLGDRGNQLSGGQRQRIAIARALYAQPEIIVFDEATSGLDKETENEVLTTIQSLPGALTRLVISHDPDTITRCDEVISLVAGRVESQSQTTPHKL